MSFLKRISAFGMQRKELNIEYDSRDFSRDPSFDWQRLQTENAEAFLQLLRTDELLPTEMERFRLTDKSWVDRDVAIANARTVLGLPELHPSAHPESYGVKIMPTEPTDEMYKKYLDNRVARNELKP